MYGSAGYGGGMVVYPGWWVGSIYRVVYTSPMVPGRHIDGVYLSPPYPGGMPGMYYTSLPPYPGSMLGMYHPSPTVPGRHAGYVLLSTVPGRHAGCVYTLLSHRTREACWVYYPSSHRTREACWVYISLYTRGGIYTRLYPPPSLAWEA